MYFNYDTFHFIQHLNQKNYFLSSFYPGCFYNQAQIRHDLVRPDSEDKRSSARIRQSTIPPHEEDPDGGL